jgi:pimeloyl-ACP methyl ester carboxylesterase
MAVRDVDGRAIGYEQRGSGPPLVLLHGAVCDRRVWRPEIEDLSDTFTVLAWDAPGCGESADPPEEFGLADYAHCLAGLLESTGVAPAHVVGHSWGGGAALQLAVTHPDLVASLVLVGGYAGWGGSLPAGEVERRLAFALEAADRMPSGFDPHAVPGLFTQRIPAARVAELEAVMADARPAATRVMAQGFAVADLRDDLPQVDVPVLLLHGESDVRAPQAVADALHAALPRSTLVVVPGAGHELALEEPLAFRTAVRCFVGGVVCARPDSRSG